VRRAAQYRGPKLFAAFSPCPPGWGYEPSQGYHVAKLVLDTGIWPLKEAVHGQVRHTYIPERRHPVEEYLTTQQRFRHLFGPERQTEILDCIQQGVDSYWKDVELRELVRERNHA
jgi:pyruvate ferredoxin oxidoreductase beta subunit